MPRRSRVPATGSQLCPFCGSPLQPFSDSRFRLCRQDQVVFNTAYAHRSYESGYFEQEYRAQYGRSYVEDRRLLLARNAWRQLQIQRLAPPTSHPRVLEVGSAAGYFLHVMQQAGYTVCGWEISAAMARYANARGLKTIRQDFLHGARRYWQQKKPPWDIVALFYVLEHLPQQKHVWEYLAKLVRPGGFLLLALPSWRGPTWRFQRPKWYETHPADHAVDYSPKALRVVGARFGFQLKLCLSEGIHPDRFPLGKIGIFQRFYRWWLQRRPISDTIFAVLERRE
ncbi:MAG: class I SAM-dependent methyltransferase [Turneriella sp.]|nr:class I SAM-dependent methyltransferase [Turneriella sp.]